MAELAKFIVIVLRYLGFCLVVEIVRRGLEVDLEHLALMTVVLHWGKPAGLTAPVTAEADEKNN